MKKTLHSNKKICLVSLYGNFNYGNKLQIYAIQKKLLDLGYNVEILRNYYSYINNLPCNITKFINRLKLCIKKFIPRKLYINKNFKIFEKKYLNITKDKAFFYEDNSRFRDRYDYFFVGSDQVWNPIFGLEDDLKFLDFAGSKTKISFAASFGVSNIPNEISDSYKKGLNNLKYISVRENAGKEIIKKITGRDDVEVLIDPTMLLTNKDWQLISKRPKQLSDEKYILNYFLGNLSDKKRNEIECFANKHGWKVINIFDKNELFYDCGPSEFIYLEEHAELICTDSFHSCVFAILMDTPFIVFDREDKNESMNSRIETLLSKFKLENRKYDGELKDNCIDCDYSNSYKILEEERKKTDNFLNRVLEIEENNEN